VDRPARRGEGGGAEGREEGFRLEKKLLLLAGAAGSGGKGENCGGGALVFGGCDFLGGVSLSGAGHTARRYAAADTAGRPPRIGRLHQGHAPPLHRARVFVRVNRVVSSAGYLVSLQLLLRAQPIKQSCHVEIFPVGTPLHCSFSMDGALVRHGKARLTWAGNGVQATHFFHGTDGQANLLPPLIARRAATVTVY
jgi:hypothetical protein